MERLQQLVSDKCGVFVVYSSILGCIVMSGLLLKGNEASNFIQVGETEILEYLSSYQLSKKCSVAWSYHIFTKH